MNTKYKVLLYLLTAVPLVCLVANESNLFPIEDFSVYFVTVVSVIIFPFKVDLSEKKYQKSFAIISVLVFLFFVLFVIINGRIPYISYLVNFVFFYIFFTLKAKYKQFIFDRFVKIVAVLFTLGLFEFTLAICGINFFWSEFQRGSVTFLQGLFVSMPAYYTFGFARFMSVCEEPGVVGTLCAFLIAVLDPSKYKKQVIVFFIAGIVSLSLAFYVLVAIWMLLNVRRGRFKEFVALIFVFVLFSFFFKDYLQDRIVERVFDKSSLKEIDNRTSEEVDRRLASLSGSELFFGVGHVQYRKWTEQNESASTGIKDFIIGYGLVGFMLSFMAISLSVIKIRGFKRQTMFLLLLYWISFYQRSYWFYIPLTVILCTADSTLLKKKH